MIIWHEIMIVSCENKPNLCSEDQKNPHPLSLSVAGKWVPHMHG